MDREFKIPQTGDTDRVRHEIDELFKYPSYTIETESSGYSATTPEVQSTPNYLDCKAIEDRIHSLRLSADRSVLETSIFRGIIDLLAGRRNLYAQLVEQEAEIGGNMFIKTEGFDNKFYYYDGLWVFYIEDKKTHQRVSDVLSYRVLADDIQKSINGRLDYTFSSNEKQGLIEAVGLYENRIKSELYKVS